MFVNRDGIVSYYMISSDTYTVREHQLVLPGIKLRGSFVGFSQSRSGIIPLQRVAHCSMFESFAARSLYCTTSFPGPFPKAREKALGTRLSTVINNTAPVSCTVCS